MSTAVASSAACSACQFQVTSAYTSTTKGSGKYQPAFSTASACGSRSALSPLIPRFAASMSTAKKSAR